LRACLEALRPETQDFSAPDFEVIVSDDTPAAQRVAEPAPDLPFVRAVEGPRRGPASNRNCGASQARGEWLIFVDDDCVPLPGFLRGYRDALRAHPDCKIFEGRIAADRPKARVDEESPISESGGFLWSCNLAIRRDLFTQLQGFCEEFPYAAMEDVDFRLRVTAAGEQFLYVPNALVIHPWRPLSTAQKVTRVHLVSMRILYARHPRERPTFIDHIRIIAREFWKGASDGVRYGFRGFWRWLWNRMLFTVADVVLAWESLFARRE
jgi:GT2 family glycosyltransferase